MLKHGWLSFLGKPLYKSLLAVELGCVRWKYRHVTFEKTPLVEEKLTAVIKTFQRPETIKRLVHSIKRFYPKMKVIIVDDSREPVSFEGVTVISLPFDSGVSAGRQKAVEQVTTPYLLLLDDDFIFYGKTNLEPALEIFDAHTEIDIMGGEVVNLPSFKSADYRNALLHPSSNVSTKPSGSFICGLPVFDKVPNFYIARTMRLKLVGWDKRIKRLDHAEFFTRAKGVLTTVFNKQFKILHAQTPFNRSYMQKRNDVEEDRKLIMAKYYNKR